MALGKTTISIDPDVRAKLEYVLAQEPYRPSLSRWINAKMEEAIAEFEEQKLVELTVVDGKVVSENAQEAFYRRRREARIARGEDPDAPEEI